MPRPKISSSTNVVDVTGNARGMTLRQKTNMLPVTMRPERASVKLGDETILMDVDEFCFRRFNARDEDGEKNKYGYSILFGFGKYIFALLEGEKCPQLTRGRWDALFDKYSNAAGSKGNVCLSDLQSSKPRSIPDGKAAKKQKDESE